MDTMLYKKKRSLRINRLSYYNTLLIMCLCAGMASAQGTIKGKVSDKKTGETLIGVTIVLKSNPSVGVTTDLDGNYTLKINDSLPQTIVLSYVSYDNIEETVHPVNGEIIVKDFGMGSGAATELGAVEIKGKAVHANVYYMETVKKNSANSIDFISSDQIRKSGDVNVTAAVARVTGVSTNGGFITVRGIGDRYVKTTINGNRIPTLDPFTNNIKLDMFPASLVDNIIITKTATPDLPGDWAGAYLSVETKDYPDALSVAIETSAGYNNQSTFKEVISSERSSTDWLGYDNTFREHDHTQFQSAVMHPGQYQELVALGLGDYYKSMGITGWVDGPGTDIYFKLGLVQLGLLSPALINNTAAVNAAKASYNNGPYHSEAFSIINAGAAKTGQSFPDNWNTTKRKAPLNFSQSFTVGDQLQFLGKPLGFIAGFRYGSATSYDPNSIKEEPNANGLIAGSAQRQVGKETNGWSALINVAYKFNPNNSVSVLFMPNLIGVNDVKDGYDTIKNTATKSQFYEARKQMMYQYKSEHYIPFAKAKLELNASYTKGNSNAPDFKYLQYDANPATNTYNIDPGVHDIERFYRYLSDNLFDSRASLEIPLSDKPGLSRKLKIGGAYQDDNTRSDQYRYYLAKDGLYAPPLQSNDIDSYFSLDQFQISNGIGSSGVPYSTLNWYYNLDSDPTSHTFSKSKISAAFIMADYTLIPRLRLSGGFRMEHTNLFTDVNKFDSLGLSDNDPRRFYKEGTLPATPGRLNQTDFLPSATLIYKLINKEENPTNIRVGYSQTLARPSLREISNTTTFDNELQENVRGNPNLKMVQIKNYDFRMESYFKNKDNISLSVFYKDFKNHIELEHADVFTWINVDKSHVTGIELEGRKGIIKGLEFRANVTLVKSYTQYVRTRQEVVGTTVTTYYEDTVKRSMFGQAPYIINGILSYTSDSLGLTATLSYNIQGPRLVIGSDNASLPDIYELQRHLLDLKLTKKLGKHFSASFTIKDILNSPVTRAYKYDTGYNVIYDQYHWGTNYILSILYKI